MVGAGPVLQHLRCFTLASCLTVSYLDCVSSYATSELSCYGYEVRLRFQLDDARCMLNVSSASSSYPHSC